MAKLRVADYIAKYIEEALGVSHVFLLTGGGNMYLTDAVLKNKNLTAVCNHHEQACAMAAVGYAKQTGKHGVVMPTTGCAGTNTITGLLDAWQDSHPCFFISGQVNTNQTCYKSSAKLRKFGTQEANILEIVKPITKAAWMVDDPNDIRWALEKAHYLSVSHRPGPVWLDIPLDVQGKYVEEDELKGWLDIPLDVQGKYEGFTSCPYPKKDTTYTFPESTRPIILAGNGVRLAEAEEELKTFSENFNVPVVSTYMGTDLLGYHHPNFIGRVGVKGDRAGNFALQNADLILSLGCSLSVPVTGYNYDHFGREARLVVVDIDREEHEKGTVRIDDFIESDVKAFLKGSTVQGSLSWLDKCRNWKTTWAYVSDQDPSDPVDLYYFTEVLSNLLPEKASVIGDAGSAYYVPCQSLKLTPPQRLIVPGAQAEMGFTIPAAIGVAVGSPESTVVGITGDGSFQFNLQELQTIKHHNLPVKLFVWNNNGYLSIRKTQERFFDGDYIGTSPDSGVSLPPLESIAKAYSIPYVCIEKTKDCPSVVESVLASKGPIICEVMCNDAQEVLPTISSMKKEDGTIIGRPLEDMHPLLSREEFYGEMIVEPIS
jgi:acetolactate synthase-1/2/3 large subunit